MNMNDVPDYGQKAIMQGDRMMTEDQYNSEMREKLAGIHQSFSTMRDKWVQHRAQSGVETRWRKASQLYFGDQSAGIGEFENTLRLGPPARQPQTAPRSKVVVNIVRPKVDQAVARMCEILYPVDERNWGIKPTPIPQVAELMESDAKTVDANGQPTGLTGREEAQALMKAAKEMCEGMERSIDDSLTQCNYNGEGRSLMENSVRLGTGILEGPFPSRRTNKVWLPQPDGSQKMVIESVIEPASASLDPWDVFFDPACGNNHQRGRGYYKRKPMTRKELRGLIGIPGYDSDAIRNVLRSEPKRVRAAEGRVMRELITDDSYEMWTYHGEIEAEDMELLSEKAGDPLVDVEFGVIVMVNDIIIGALESWVPDNTLPVDVYCWRDADDSPYGFGLPHELEHQQSVVTSAWRQVMDNARVTMGGQIVMKKSQVLPQNGKYDLEPLKVWLAEDDLADIRQAFAVFEFNSHLQELLAVAQAAMQMADTETNMPLLMGGQQGSAPETVGGMVMLSNNAQGPLRYRVKRFDDKITKPHIGRYYDWKMMNDPDPKIKGDMEVDARGSSALVERDIQNQALVNLVNITSNPRYAGLVKEKEELQAILRAFKIDPESIMKSDDEIKQAQDAAAQQPAAQDPQAVAAQMQLQIKQMDIQDKQEQRQFDDTKQQRELEFRQQNLRYNAMREQSEAEQSSVDSQLSREVALAKLQQDGQLTREELETKSRLEMIKISDGRERFNAEAALRVQTGAGI